MKLKKSFNNGLALYLSKKADLNRNPMVTENILTVF